MKLLQAAIYWYLAGSMFMLISADFNFDIWGRFDDIYFIWDRGNYVLFFGSILYLMPVTYRWLMRPLFIYSIILLSWEIIRLITHWDVNNPTMVTMVFTALQAGVAVLLITDLIKRKKERK